MTAQTRRLLVDQRESTAGQFWYVVRGGNGQVLTTSETYSSRDGAVRAARNFIVLIDPVPVMFSRWTGDRPPRAVLNRTRVYEDFR